MLGVIIIPRIDARVSCEFTTAVDVNVVGEAVARAIRNLTGANCQVIANSRDLPGSMGRVGMWWIGEGRRRNNIELMPPGR